MTKYTFLTLTTLFISLALNAQTATGLVVEENNEPISYATVQIGENYGVITNQEGKFSIDISKFEKTDLAIISFIGFESLVLNVGELESQGTFKLLTSLMSLDQIFLTNKKYTPEELLDQVISHIDSNYSKIPSQRKVFLRRSLYNEPQDLKFEFKKSSLFSKSTLRKINKEAEDQGASILGKSSTNFEETLAEYYQYGKESKSSNLKTTVLINKKKDLSASNVNEKMNGILKSHLEPNRTYKVKTGILTVDDSLEVKSKDGNSAFKNERETSELTATLDQVAATANLFNERIDFIYQPKKYNYTLENASVFDNQTVYILGFTPDKKSAKYEGKLYINAEDFSIMKMEYKIADGKDGASMNLKFLLGIKMVEQEGSYLVIFKKDIESNKYLPSLIKNKIRAYNYFNRSLKFTQNKIDEDEDKKMLKFETLIEMISITDNELYFLDFQKIENLESLNLQKEYPVEYLKSYDPKIWEQYNIIQPISDLKDYVTE